MTWETVAYTFLFGGFFALGASGYMLHRVCIRLSMVHPETFHRLGEPSVRRPGRWPSIALRDFVGSREYVVLNDPELAALCRKFSTSVRVAAAFAAVAFIAVFAEAFARGA